jgi:hypothetical protein
MFILDPGFFICPGSQIRNTAVGTRVNFLPDLRTLIQCLWLRIHLSHLEGQNVKIFEKFLLNVSTVHR